MDFGALPPEINSGRMYAGPGSGPLLAAAAAWEGLAADLRSTATSYQSVVSELTSGAWRGPASTAMATAATTHVAWLTATAAQTEQSASQARAAAAAYEMAFAMTVPPSVIAANRSLLMALIATNFLGQNTPAIMATEAHYAEMWAQDAAAMYAYAGSSAAATALTPFSPPHQNTNPAGLAAQAAAVAQAIGAAAGTETQTTFARLVSSVPTALQGFAVPGLSANPPSWLDYMLGSMTLSSGFASITSSLTGIIRMLTPAAQAVEHAATTGGSTFAAGLGARATGLRSASSGGATIAANLGRAASIGRLSVPQSWAAAIPATSTPGPSSLAAAAAPQACTPEGVLGGLPTAMPFRGTSGGVLRVGQRRFVMPRPTCAG